MPDSARIYTSRFLVPGDAPPIEGGALLAVDGRIVSRGSFQELKKNHPSVQVVDYGEAIIVPLFVNAHTHLELSDFSEWANKSGATQSPVDFVDWILRLIKVKAGLDKHAYASSLAHGIELSIASGTGAVGDILAHHRARSVYQSCPLEGWVFLETLGQDPALIPKLEERLKVALADQRVERLALGVSPHSPYTCSADYLQRLYAHCRREKILCSTHLAESPEETTLIEQGRGPMASQFYPFVGWENFVPRGSGLRPVEYLQQQGGLISENLLVHGVQLNDDEIEVLARHNMSLVLCPRSNTKLNVGKAPAGKLFAAGVKLSLGTDSLASNDSLSIWDEMNSAASCFVGELDAPTLFRLATQGGAEALRVDDRLGTLELGKQAGFQVLKAETEVAQKDIFDYFVAPGRQQDIVQVVLHGQPWFKMK
ncbi:MAG: amidohydrolase family protein [Desulfuromonadales bacterium]|nr:amidohydrolase family protein [Desulfuromonadales bacterium]MBN2793483.1 amidohydrolase family protein [Desulfuromonadales bacterium]